MKVIIAPSTFAAEDDAPLRILKSAGLEVLPNPVGRRWTEDETIRFLEGIDGLVAGLEPLNRRVLATAKGTLRALARVGIGISNVDQAAASEFGIKVSSTPDAPAEAVAEMTLAAMLALLRDLVPMNSSLHSGKWDKRVGRSVREIAVLIVGYGRIGRLFARLAKSLGATIHVFDPQVKTGDGVADVVHPTLAAALPLADVISLHAGGDQVLLGTSQFTAMKNGAVLLNSARGELVDEAALVTALESGRVSKAWFDAFWQEPYSGDLARFPQVLMTPHTSTYTRWCRREMESQAAQNLVRDLSR